MSRSSTTILFVHQSADLYGSDITLLQLVSAVVERLARVIVVVPYRGPLVDRLQEVGADVVIHESLPVLRRQHMSFRGLLHLVSSLWSIVWLAVLIRRQHVAIIHSNTLAVSIAGVAAKLARRTQVWHVHEIMVRPSVVASLLATLSSAVSTVVVANSKATADYHIRTRWFSSTPVKVIMNGVDESRLRSRSKLSLRSLVGASPKDTVFALVGRINAGKGHLVFLDAAERLATQSDNVHFLIVGDSFVGQEQYSEAVDRRIESSSILRERAIRVPHVPEVGSVYAAADVVVVPSTLPESFGLVAAEAMSAGLPVIASRIGALPEVVEEQRTGVLVDPDDAASLLAAMKSLSTSSSRRVEMGREGRERFERLFGAQRYVDEFIGLYEELLGTARHVSEPRAEQSNEQSAH